MVQPVKKLRNVHKRTKRFNRHQSDRFDRLKPSWRRPKGIDNAMRRKFKGHGLMPNIGYGTNSKTRHVLPSGLQKLLVKNLGDLELLMMHNRTYALRLHTMCPL